jgi:predicted NACHT family NTPase
MAVEIAAFIFEQVKSVVLDAVKKQVGYEAENYFTKFKIEHGLLKSVARVVEPLVPFLTNEKVSELQQQLLIETCTSELHRFIEEPLRIFEASLDGEKVYQLLYKDKALPTAIREEGLQGTYSILLPRIANLICTFPPAIKAWQLDGWKEGFKRLDEISERLRGVGLKVDQLAAQTALETDDVLIRIRQSLLQRVQFKLELTGLRPDRPIEPGRIEDLFVLPAIVRRIQGRPDRIVDELVAMRETFLKRGSREVVIGQPGSGKTTWVDWLQSQALSQSDPRLAVVIRLRELSAAKLPSLHQLVREAAGPHLMEEVESHHIRNWLDNGRIALMFDGFDEIVSLPF